MFEENLVVTGWRGKVSPVLPALAGAAVGYVPTLFALSLGGLLLVLPRYADAGPDSCVATPGISTETTCSGNQRSGVASGIDFSSPPIRSLDVKDLSGDIIPSTGVSGIRFLASGTDGTDESTSAGSFFGSGPDGGTGATGGSIDIDFFGDVYRLVARGGAAHGITARSLGGDGGDGGWATGATLPLPPPVFVCPACGPAWGGDGGNARNGGTVDVWSNAAISTDGERAHGIFAESRGGNGGKGGWAFSTTFAQGGDGGVGASGGTVIVTSLGPITTNGANSRGIYAKSTGGKGGSGGRGDGTFGSAGDGEGTGNGGAITVTNSGDITTHGEGSTAIEANSTGGGGGDGGGAGGIFTFGGDGFSAGHGGTVTVANHGRLETEEDNASGVLAQSVGGGGGNGGGAIAAGPVFSLALGGDGGPGGLGGAVDVDSHPTSETDIILTQGNSSHGISAQSTGGGGGNGGYAVSVAVGEKVAVAVAVGGSAEGGSDGGFVDVNTSSDIQTLGKGSHGIFADSTGGGGGNGGSSFAGAVSAKGSIAVSVGGGAGGGGNSAPSVRNAQETILTRSVTVLNSGDITTGSAAKNDVAMDQLVSLNSAQLAALQDYAYTVSNGEVSTFTIAQLDGMSQEELAGIAGFDDAAAAEIKIEARTFMLQDAGSYGIYARGIGGGGGDGGMAVAGSMSFGPGAVAVALGGKGDKGGHGGSVKVTNNGNIVTHGEGSHGIVAFSLGGGGGNGGGSVAGTIGASSGTNVGIGVSVGGGGKGGGRGDDVLVVNNGSITTHNINSYGIMATSTGGGGGNGGFAVAGSLTASTETSVNIDVSVGGEGGLGNEGGDVEVQNNGLIETFEENSHAIFAQSVGGKGGNGGFSLAGAVAAGGEKNFNAVVSVGGSAGNGSVGGKVVVANTQDIITHEAESYGVFAQSVGGGGGTGGSSIAASASFFKGKDDKGMNISADLSFGGSGGEGNLGGEVEVTNSGSIHTVGVNSHGIFAQSIGGGGGQGGSARAASLIASPCGGFGPAKVGLPFYTKYKNPLKKGNCAGSTYAFNLSMGGSGDQGGDGEKVTITNTRDIRTEGVDSHGIWAQSVGAGGGSGGEGAYGWWGVPLVGLDRPAPWENLSIAIGGSAGSSGDGGAIEINHTSGKISTAGDGSFGIFAQSVGGGGGQGGHGAIGLTGIVGVGGSGGTSGSGGNIEVNVGSATTTSDIETLGNSAHGVYAQSVGGGGGLAGNVERGLGIFGVNFGVGAGVTKNAGNAGDGGEVTVTSFGNITTKGQASYGIYTQSVGGGGGLTGDAGTGITFAGSAGGNGTAKKVTVHHTGNITTGIAGKDEATVDQLVNVDSAYLALLQANGVATISGLAITPAANLAAIDGIDDATAGSILLHAERFMQQGVNSHGIVAQSGGGLQHDVNILDAEGNVVGVLPGSVSRGGDVEILVNGDITAYGTSSNGIHVNSHGGDGNGNIDITVNGRVQGGAGSSVGINIQAGATNVVTIGETGTVTNIDGVAGSAIHSTEANEEVRNSGLVIGSMDLGGGGNAFNNLASGRLHAGASIDLGAGNFLTSDGMVSPAGVGEVFTSSVTGNLAQNSSGVYLVDVDVQNQQADRINISGTSTLDGSVEVNRLYSGFAVPGTTEYTVASSAGTILDRSGLELTAAASAVVSYELLDDPSDDINLVLSSTVDFSSSGKGRRKFRRNREAFGRYVNAIQLAGGSEEFAPLAAGFVELPDQASLGRTYDRLMSEALAILDIETVSGSRFFNDALHSCRQREGGYRFIREGDCGWMEVEGSIRDQDRTSENPGYDLSTVSVAGGVQREVAADTHLGGGLSLLRSNLNAPLADSDGYQAEVGAVLKRRFAGTMVSGSISGGYGWYDTKRDVGLAMGKAANSDQDIFFGAAHGRVTHDFEPWENGYIRPVVDVGYTRVYRNAFKENGAGAANLDVDSEDESYVTAQAAIEFGGEFQLESGTLVRPFVNVGATQYLSDNTSQVTASLESAPSSVAPFTIEAESDRTYADVSVGVDLIRSGGSSLRFEYTGQFSDNSDSHAAGIKFSLPF